MSESLGGNNNQESFAAKQRRLSALATDAVTSQAETPKIRNKADFDSALTVAADKCKSEYEAADSKEGRDGILRKSLQNAGFDVSALDQRKSAAGRSLREMADGQGETFGDNPLVKALELRLEGRFLDADDQEVIGDAWDIYAEKVLDNQ